MGTKIGIDMKNTEPTEEEIKYYAEQHGLSYYEARERLRDEAYHEDYGLEKPDGISWGDFWKTY